MTPRVTLILKRAFSPLGETHLWASHPQAHDMVNGVTEHTHIGRDINLSRQTIATISSFPNTDVPNLFLLIVHCFTFLHYCPFLTLKVGT